jgi:hypothetical protein
VNNYQAGTVDSPKTTMSRVSSPKPVKGIERKCSGRRLRTSNGFEIHEAPWKMLTTESLNRSSICVLHHVRSSLWRGYLRCLSLRDLVFSPCVRGGSRIAFRYRTSTLPIDRLQCLFRWPWRIYSPTYSKALT